MSPRNSVTWNNVATPNVMYELTGIVVHEGASINSGHYYSITHCWDNGDAFKLNDLKKKELRNYQLDIERGKAYMLVFNKKPNDQMEHNESNDDQMSEPESKEYVLYDEVIMNRYFDQMENNEENDT